LKPRIWASDLTSEVYVLVEGQLDKCEIGVV